MNRPLGINRLTTLVFTAVTIAFSLGCSRESSVYSDPAPTSAILPVSTDGRAYLPKDFFNQSVNRSSVEIQPDGVTSTSKALRFQTSSGANVAGGFNGAGLGNRAIVGINGWNGRPVADAEPITFDSKNFAGTENIGANLQIDLRCDDTAVHVVNAASANIAVQHHTTAGDGYTRYTASTLAAVWLSPTAPILDPDTSSVLVPSTGTPVSLLALLAKFPSACLKNAATSANDLAKGIPTAAVLISLGDDSTINQNSSFIRRLTIGAKVYDGFE